jgi:hypothetical protein
VAACAVVGPVLAALGLVEITLGIIAEVLIRMHYELQQKAPYRVRAVRNLTGVRTIVDDRGGSLR